MRLAFAASALCLGALGLGLLALAEQPVTPASPAPASKAPSASNAPAASTPVAAAAGDAAARHIKRTACLKEAKARKLIGAEKTTFLKTCIDTPSEPMSASRRIFPDRP